MISENSIEISNIKIVKDAVEIDMSGVNIEVQGGEPVYEKLEVNANGTYTPTGETDAFNEVVVSVPERVPVLESIIIGENGLYTPTADIDGYDEIIVTVPARVPVLENIEVTENGTYTASDGYDGLGEVVVDVKAEGENPYSELSRHILEEYTDEYEINDNDLIFKDDITAHKIKDYAFYYDTRLTSFISNTVTEVGERAFYRNTKLKKFIGYKVKKLGAGAFGAGGNTVGWYTPLEELYLPVIENIGSTCFSYSLIKEMNFPKLNTISSQAFYNCKNLEKIELYVLKSISTNAFQYCSKLNTVILRNTMMVTLSNVNAFDSTPIKTSTTSGFIYVPDDLVESYKTATNWVTYASKIKPLSELEV